eukprot:m.97819 g.97819  ORF g.97819 m.97819 type:complete len:217 (-) comp13612_c0_seq7:2968-3618(-)
MVLMTLIARLNDGLHMCASTEDDASKGIREYKGYAKELINGLDSQAPHRCTVTTKGSYEFHYAIEKGVVYLALCSSQFPKSNAFSYLEEIQAEFDNQYGDQVDVQARPYCFIAFDKFVQRTKKKYTDTGGARSNLEKVNTELSQVTRIMTQNLEEVMDRGAQLGEMKEKSMSLSLRSKQYLHDSKKLAWDIWVRKWAPVICIVAVLVVLFLWFFIF